MKYEKYHEELLPTRQFARRMFGHLLVGIVLLLVVLGTGVAGYHGFEGLSWLDALLNASMILGGMGPVDPIRTSGGKMFASVYALFSGLFVLVVASLMIAPVAHRILHRFHMDEERDG
ncbi:MAG: hypothetical protein SGI90_01640 [Candidatus Eisenbacteria bacterium]|nr:hypothetical protein [Candidatus Eisenbacteria bacterium]